MDNQVTTDTEKRDPRRASVPTPRAPDPDTVFRREGADQTLGDGSKAPTTRAWAPTPTLTDRRVLEAPAYVVDEDEAGPGGRVVAGLRRLGRPAELITSLGVGGVAGPATGSAVYPSVVHIGSASAVLGDSARTAERTVAAYRSGATITYDPAIRPELMGTPADVREAVEARVAAADVVKVSTRDLGWLYPDDEARAVAARWLATGPSVVVVSAGAEGAWAVNAVGVVAASSGPAVDDAATGVTDAFMAGVLDALWKGGLLGVAARTDLPTLVWGSLKELVDHATAAAAIALRSGGEPPTRAELEEARGIPRISA